MDNAEFESLILPLLESGYRLAYRRTQDREEAEDIVQIAVHNAIKGRNTFQPGTSFRAWFFQILIHATSRNAKKNRKQSTISVNDLPELVLFDLEASRREMHQDGDPHQGLVDTITTEMVMKALESLPHDYQETSRLYLFEELSYEEIGQVLGVPIGTVRSRIHRGRNLLQRSLKEQLLGGDRE